VGYRGLVDAILVVHFGFLGFVIFGGFLAWRWRWVIWPHVAAAVWGLIVITGSVSCPLTVAESWARQHAGQGAVTRSFIDRYLTGVVYPAHLAVEMRYLVAAVVLGSWVGWWLRRRQRNSSTRPPTTTNATSATRKATPS
jgi:Protein of Unknown function (DUF2784)